MDNDSSCGKELPINRQEILESLCKKNIVLHSYLHTNDWTRPFRYSTNIIFFDTDYSTILNYVCTLQPAY